MSRDPLDRYYTDDRLADRCIEWLFARLDDPELILEPYAGGGAFGRAAMRARPSIDVRGCDIDPDAAPGYPCDRVSAAEWKPDTKHDFPTWIVTNPAYTDIYRTISTMRALQQRVRANILALLLRATTIEQIMNLGDPPSSLAVSPQRPRWGGPGGAALTSGDTCGSVLCVWGMGPTKTHTVIHGLGDWRPRGRG